MGRHIFVFIITIISVVFIGVNPASCQKLIADTTFIQVPVDSNFTRVKGRLLQFNDTRSKDKEVLRITEKKVYNYIPVDHYIMIDTTMGFYISSLFDTVSNTNYMITLHRFDIGERKGLIFPAITFQGEFDLKKIADTDTLTGKLLYDEWISTRGQKKDAPPKEVLLMEKWENRFIKDLKTIQEYSFDSEDVLPYNFVSADRTPKTNLEVSSRFIGGLDFFIVQGEIMFSEPEANRRTLRTGHIFRYRNAENLESVGFGRKAEHMIFRRRESLVFDITANAMLGINRWRDINEVEHPIWHVIMFDVSFGQYIKYQPFHNQPTFLVGTGLFENIFYIPDDALYFKTGLGIQIGYRF